VNSTVVALLAVTICARAMRSGSRGMVPASAPCPPTPASRPGFVRRRDRRPQTAVRSNDAVTARQVRRAVAVRDVEIPIRGTPRGIATARLRYMPMPSMPPGTVKVAD
jgi:hypothetical protein